MEKITFTEEDGSKVEFFVEEQTKVNGVNYLLVSDSLQEEAEALILKDVSDSSNEEATYLIVEDDEELDVIARIFEELMEVEIEKE
ncbi:MAG TPA: DUF1292 domain-containing protein [Lachnospiraceae bacterium]